MANEVNEDPPKGSGEMGEGAKAYAELGSPTDEEIKPTDDEIAELQAMAENWDIGHLDDLRNELPGLEQAVKNNESAKAGWEGILANGVNGVPLDSTETERIEGWVQRVDKESAYWRYAMDLMRDKIAKLEQPK